VGEIVRARAITALASRYGYIEVVGVMLTRVSILCRGAGILSMDRDRGGVAVALAHKR